MRAMPNLTVRLYFLCCFIKLQFYVVQFYHGNITILPCVAISLYIYFREPAGRFSTIHIDSVLSDLIKCDIRIFLVEHVFYMRFVYNVNL